jgi:uncharacterized membrane protein
MIEFLIIVGWLLVIMSGFVILIKAFKENAVWGLCCIFIPIMQIVFVIMNWDECKNVFYVQLGGLAMVLLGAAMAQ